jgi:hypothetical protein
MAGGSAAEYFLYVFLGMALLSAALATAALALIHRWKSEIARADKGLCAALATMVLILNSVATALCLVGWALASFVTIGFD